jgi:hypothetical protein
MTNMNLYEHYSVQRSLVQSLKFFIPIKGPEGDTDNTATYTFIIKTHSIEQFNQNEITLQDCSIIIIYIYIYIFS